jgi:hypothetical protein
VNLPKGAVLGCPSFLGGKMSEKYKPIPGADVLVALAEFKGATEKLKRLYSGAMLDPQLKSNIERDINEVLLEMPWRWTREIVKRGFNLNN